MLKVSSECLTSLKTALTSELKQLPVSGKIVISWMCSSHVYSPLGYSSDTQNRVTSMTKQSMKAVQMLYAIQLLNDDML